MESAYNLLIAGYVAIAAVFYVFLAVVTLFLIVFGISNLLERALSEVERWFD